MAGLRSGVACQLLWLPLFGALTLATAAAATASPPASSAAAAAAAAAACSAGLAEETPTSPASYMTVGQLAATTLNLLAAGAACLSPHQRQRLSMAFHLAIF
mmetsp:Transcript_52318/g.144945  ORF Transcript_52318/g.144945 Transcript_52318/m.144945 type:complete len:102 (-) Transcript_52318:153-458(-)